MTAIYRHASKTEWGLAMVAWEQDGRRGYQFEDGALRVFKEGYYNRLEEVDATADRVAGLAALLRHKVPPSERPASKQDDLSISLDEQIDYFLRGYPKGFEDDKWIAEHRTGKRTLKSHRDPAIAVAAIELSDGALQSFADSHREQEATEALRAMLARTDLVPPSQIKLLSGLHNEPARAIVAALRDLLWQSDPFPRRFASWVTALATGCGRSPGWELTTAPMALVHPADHVCIRASSFQAQASWMAPSLRFGPQPLASVYLRGIAMAQLIRQRVAGRDEPGTAATDLFDVHDFIGHTRSTQACADIISRRPDESSDS